jgi:tryptophan-rich sensory protein
MMYSSQVWTALYGLMGYASHLAVRSFDSAVTPQGTYVILPALEFVLILDIVLKPTKRSSCTMLSLRLICSGHRCSLAVRLPAVADRP